MAGKSLVGELNNTASRTKYTGNTTNSLRLYVDNSTMTISGDVIWSDALGEIASRAYPGDKGARNYTKICELTKALDYELKQASKFRSSSSTELKTLTKLVEDLNKTVEAEVCRAKQEENELHAKTTREIDRSITTDNELFSRLNEETSARKKSGIELMNLITSVKGEVVSEADRAASTEIALNEKLNDLEDHLKLEDAHLQRQISDLITTIDSDTVRLASTDGTPHVYAVTGSIQHTYPLSSEILPEAIVKRDQYGNILLSEETIVDPAAAVPKSYVDCAVDEVAANLTSRLDEIDFIDGGNAPI